MAERENIERSVKRLRFDMDMPENGKKTRGFDQLLPPQPFKVETEVTVDENQTKSFKEIVTNKITSKMSSIIEPSNSSPKRRQTIFDFSAKETKKMNDEVKFAMKKMPLKKTKIRIDIPEINQDHSNIVYGMVAVFSGLVFWILPAFYTRYALPYLFEELAPLYEST